MSELDAPHKSIGNPPPRPIRGFKFFLIVGGSAVLAVILAVTLGEVLDPVHILLIGFFGAILSIPVVSFVNTFAKGKIARHKEKIVNDQKQYESAQNEVRQRNEKDRQKEIRNSVGKYTDLGYELRSVKDAMTEAGRDGIDPKSALTKYLLGPVFQECSIIRKALKKAQHRSATDSELLSYCVSSEFISIVRETSADEFRADLVEALRAEVQAIEGDPGDLKSSNLHAVEFEVQIIPEIPSDMVLVARKRRMRGESLVFFQGFPMLADWKERDTGTLPFCRWDTLPSGNWRMSPARYFYGGRDSTITMSPMFKTKDGINFNSAIVDMWTDRLDKAMTIRVEKLVSDESLQKKLGIKIVDEHSPYTVADVLQQDKKGYIRVVGWFIRGNWEPWDAEVDQESTLTSMLHASAPNFLIHPYEAAFSLEGTEQNKLLTDFLNSDLGNVRKSVVSTQGGNFEIRRGPISKKSRICKYFIRLCKNATVTKFCKPRPENEDEYQQFESYEDFPKPRPEFSPLEDQGFSSIPASNCYFRTGHDEIQLVLKVNLGSPALGEMENKGVFYDHTQLRAALVNFANRIGVEDLEVLELESAQGLVSKGKLNSKPEYYKLLDPTHASFFASARITEKLRKASIIPAEIKVISIDTYGDEVPGMIPVFQMPEYLSVTKFISEEEFDREAFEKVARSLCLELLRFAKNTLEQGVVCSDLTLEDTFFPEKDTAVDFLLSDDRSQLPGLFVGDFGSYVEEIGFKRSDTVAREQYRPPEDGDESLLFVADKYIVFLLGLLWIEIYGDSPGRPLDTLNRLHLGLSREDYEESIESEVKRLCKSQSESVVNTILGMLEYCPDERPQLNEIDL